MLTSTQLHHWGHTTEGDIASQIRQHLSNLKVKVSETGAELDRIRQEQEAFSMEYYSFREMSGKFESMKQQVRFFFTQLTHSKRPLGCGSLKLVGKN